MVLSCPYLTSTSQVNPPVGLDSICLLFSLFGIGEAPCPFDPISSAHLTDSSHYTSK